MYPRLLSPIVALVLGACAAHAQEIELNPITSQAGAAAAHAEAVSELAADAVPVFIGAVGNSTYDFNGMKVPLRFYLENGRSTSWAYSFYSPSLNRRALIAVVDIPQAGMQAFPVSSPVPIPELTVAIDPALPYFASDAAIARLGADSVYRRYRTELPAKLPETIGLRPASGADSALLPAWFPLDKPVWVMRFSGDGDSAMACFVASGTGATVCIRAGLASAPRLDAPDARMNLSKGE